MSNSVTAKLVEFFREGVILTGGSRTLMSAAGLAVASAVVLAGAFSPATAEELALPSLDGAVTAALVDKVQNRIDAEYPDNTVLIVSDTDSVNEEFAASVEEGKNPTCIVYAQPFRSTERAMPGVALGNVTTDAYASFRLWSSVGTCLGTESVAQANAFGLMMATHDTGSTDLPDLMAAWTDLQELRGALSGSEYWSPAAYKAAEAMDSNSVRNALEVFGASAALDFTSRFGAAPVLTSKMSIGRSMFDALRAEHHYMQVEGGLVDTDSYHWMRHAQEVIPEVAHYLALYDYLAEDDFRRTPPAQHVIDMGTSAFAVDILASQGDSTARALASGYGLDTDYSYEPVYTNVDLPARDEVRGVFFELDLQDLYVTFAKDGTRFAVSQEDRRPVAFAETVLHDDENARIDGKITVYAELHASNGMKP